MADRGADRSAPPRCTACGFGGQHDPSVPGRGDSYWGRKHLHEHPRVVRYPHDLPMGSPRGAHLSARSRGKCRRRAQAARLPVPARGQWRLVPKRPASGHVEVPLIKRRARPPADPDPARGLTTKRGRLIVLAVVCATCIPGEANAKVRPALSDYEPIKSVVVQASDGFFCPPRRSTWISTVNRRWAVARALSNCGQGSQTARFFLRRGTTPGSAWRIVERRFERPGTGRTTACGSRRVPRDIRCA